MLVNPSPDVMPWASNILAEEWMADALKEGEREFAVPGTRIRHSWAGMCSRRIWYEMQKVEPTNPLNETSYYTFGIGQALHEKYQEKLQLKYGDSVTIEEKIHNKDANSSGHVDATLRLDRTISMEIKTINDVGYKKAIGLPGTPQGPRYLAITQGAVNAVTQDADELIIVYLPLAAISRTQSSRYGVPPELCHGAQWTITKDEFTEIGERELERFKWLNYSFDNNEKPPRWIPDPDLPERSLVVDPLKGVTLNPEGVKARTWQCDYCPFQDYCARDD